MRQIACVLTLCSSIGTVPAADVAIVANTVEGIVGEQNPKGVIRIQRPEAK